MANSIRELIKLQDKALGEYHEKHAALQDQIESIRAKRGTVLKKADYSGIPYIEEGRDAERTNGNW